MMLLMPSHPSSTGCDAACNASENKIFDDRTLGPKSAHDLGRDKLKNASILRKYGSIVWGIDKLFIQVSAQK